MKEEVDRCHEAITNLTGIEPTGFVAPVWNSSDRLLEYLIERRYTYDNSVFPSLFLYPMIAKIFWNHFGNEKNKAWASFGRCDWQKPFGNKTPPFFP